jgi:hypothetical protein
MATGLNAEFVRSWTEVSIERIGFSLSRSTAAQSGCKWFPYANGGEFRKWYGNYDDVVNWENDGERLQTEEHESGRIRAVNLNLEYIFTKGLSWTSITSGHFSIRYLPPGFLFSSASNALFTQDDLRVYLGLLNSKVHSFLGKALNPTLNANPGDIGKIPLPASSFECTDKVDDIVRIHKVDWDSFEGSWNFNGMALLSADFHAPTIESAYRRLRVNWTKLTTQARQIEEAINHTLIEAYGLRGAISAEVPLNEVTLTCNPAYRYKGVKSEEELESLLLADTVTELISYAVACMFGRYALEKSGLILANQGDTIEQYFSQIPNPSFRPDKDNVIPILNKDWFPDDISGRFKKFLRVTFGDEHFEENLKFIEQSIGKDIRTYFAKDFYNDHVKRYKKRPIYWMFSSPKGSFNALIYMHRYRPDTVSVVLNDYLIEFRTKLISSLDYEKRKEASADTSKAEKTKALKEIEILKKTIDELATWERDVLYDLAGQRIEIDLDNGVKKNYAMFGAALKKIPGLDVSEE